MLDAEDARGHGPAGLGPLQEGLASTDPRIQAVAVRALGRFEDPELIGTIAPLLSSSHPEVRAEAVNALGQAVFSADGDSVAAILRGHLGGETDPGVRGAIGRTLGRLRYADPTGVREADETLRETTITESNDAPFPTLLGAAMGLESLARRNRGTTLSEATIGRLRELTSYGIPSGGNGPTEAPRVRRVALMALVAGGGAGEETLRGALEDPDPDVRRISVSAVVQDASFPGSLEALDQALKDPVARVRAQAVAAYSARAPEDQRCPGLLEAAQDDHPQVALAALDLLGTPCPDSDQQIQTLREFVENAEAASPTQWHRAAHALVALAGASPETAAPLVSEFASHVSPFARTYAAQAAALTGDKDVLEFLAQDEAPNVRTAAIQGLFRLEGHQADPLLLAQLSQDEPQLLLTAVGLLEGTPEPRAAMLPLLEALHRISAQGQETARDTRLGILERLAEVAGGDATETEAVGKEAAEELEEYLSDYDPLIAERVAGLLTEWTGTPRKASPQPAARIPVPSSEEVDRLARSQVVLEMDDGGEVVIRLLAQMAPTNAARFARLAASGSLDGLTFHRVVSNFVIQGGSPDANEMSGHGSFSRDEIGLQSNWRGTVGTSTRGRDTGDGQFFVNVVDNLRLDHNYTIFGQVLAGMDVVDRLVEGQVIRLARVVGP
ncbi:MAG: HEAT repeat domain-containing protein [Longimicrobiales bacterium]|nr:HEAT repeat domain-containing protein [Longimicrobiales bacterium]